MKPKDVNRKNENEVWITLFGSGFGKLPLPKFRIGDTVRVSTKMFLKRDTKLILPKKYLKLVKSLEETRPCTN